MRDPAMDAQKISFAVIPLLLRHLRERRIYLINSKFAELGKRRQRYGQNQRLRTSVGTPRRFLVLCRVFVLIVLVATLSVRDPRTKKLALVSASSLLLLLVFVI